jgi:type IV pilus assembly protein PilB
VTDVIGRFINMGVEPYNLFPLNCIMAQRPGSRNLHGASLKYSSKLKEAGLDPPVWATSRCRGRWLPGMLRHGVSWPDRDLRMLDLTDRIREMIVDRRPTSEISASREE